MDKEQLMNVLKVIKEERQSELNHIPREARNNILDFAQKENLIDGLTSTKDGLIGNPRITLKGIEYYEENKKTTKFYNTLKEARGWLPFF